jgi:hypothetical protein
MAGETSAESRDAGAERGGPLWKNGPKKRATLRPSGRMRRIGRIQGRLYRYLAKIGAPAHKFDFINSNCCGTKPTFAQAVGQRALCPRRVLPVVFSGGYYSR